MSGDEIGLCEHDWSIKLLMIKWKEKQNLLI